MPTLDDFDASLGIKRTPEPGDPDFEWSAHAGYDPKDRLVGEAKQTLAKSQQLADSSGLSRLEANPPIPTPQSPSSADTVSNFLKNAWQSYGFNPSNIVEGAKAIIPGTEANQRYQQSLAEHPFMSALQQASPLTGGAGFTAGERIGQGDISGGLGEMAGDIATVGTGALLPEIPGAVRAASRATGRGIGAMGRGMEAVGASAPARTSGSLATLNAIVRPSVGSIAAATIPPALEYGGRGFQRLGSMLEGLGKGASEAPIAEYARRPVAPMRMSQEVPGSSYGGEPVSYRGPQYGPDSRRPFTSGDPVIAARFGGPTSPEAIADNLNSNAAYGEGHIVPGPMASEYAQPDVIQSYEQTAEGLHPTVHVPSDLTFEAGQADVPGITINGQQFPTPPPSIPPSILNLKNSGAFRNLPNDPEAAQSIAASKAASRARAIRRAKQK